MTGSSPARTASSDWVAQIADRVIRAYEKRTADGKAGDKVVCASGISPSGPIHLGNLRELLVPHFVAEEIKARGIPCEHLLSWDDFDRLRKVPAGVPASFAEHVGRPLTGIPDPYGELDSWAERFKTPFRAAIARLGVEIREISQTEMYTAGAYRNQILSALDQRLAINDVLARFRTLEAEAGITPDADDDDGAPATETQAEDDSDVEIGSSYWPYKVYCHACGRDHTHLTAVEHAADGGVWVSYACDGCGHSGRFDLNVENPGKLVWKVDWPMRWAYERVTFEAGGADHSSPGSSFSVGSDLVRSIFDGLPPEYVAYSFVGTRGEGKMSSSRGAVPTPSDALEVLEVPILRWLYVRKAPRQGISIDLAEGIHALYDEWDALSRKAADGKAQASMGLAYDRARATAQAGEFERPGVVVPFRTLASAVSVAAGDPTQTTRIVGVLAELDEADVARTEPRLGLAKRWMEAYAPPAERITVRPEPDRERLAHLDDSEARWLELLMEHLDDDWTLEGARTLAYGVPKLALGLPLDTDPTAELKVAQREFFKLLYQLILSADTGPRIPTLLLALGQEQVRHLLTPAP
ncbi:MAG: lysine--tRNA ligase [Acidimicrobiales bacterium]